MEPLRRAFSTVVDNSPLSSHEKKTHRRNEFGSYASRQKRAAFTREHWTCQNESYRFPVDESPKDPWERCYEVVDQADEELYKELKDEISGLLVVASLFLGIVTAFSTMTLGWIRVDDRKVSTALLGDIVTLLNNTDARGTIPPRDVTNLNFVPRNSDIVVNQMWFLSMTLSLSAVVAGTLCLQWLSAFRRKELKQRPFIDALALRQLRFEGLMGWGVPQVPAFLLLTVQGSLVLFAIGLIYLLWSVDNRVAIPVVLVGGAAAIFLTITAIMPLLQSAIGWIFPSTLIVPQCPYKSPVSWILHRGCILLSIIVTFPFCPPPYLDKPKVLPSNSDSWPQKLSRWRSGQVDILKDYTWQTFDDLWRRQRERWGPQQSKTPKSKYSYYLVNGLASAMDKLVFQPNAVKQALREYNAIVKEVAGEKSEPRLSASHKENLRRDFLNAYALQHFVSQNPKLHQALLPHRVELYTRIKNSSRHLDPLPQGAKDKTKAKSKYVGASIKCPIRCTADVEALSSELQYQFLNLADWFMHTDKYGELDHRSVGHVLDAGRKRKTLSDADADADEPSWEDRVKNVLKMIEKYLTEKSHHGMEPSSGNTTACEIGGENGPLLERGRVDQSFISCLRRSDSPSDQESSPDNSFSTVLAKLHASVQAQFNNHPLTNCADPHPCHQLSPV
ncbi:hypothetical protein AGABI2DRAFT_181675 [Agaricus bisporus var. bisporus H97]|uniref:hypothetical protein n=1 Tax=Agaricus bisporus var. bisporus (strain H97 / ATCC MYA-4626 / FGSC 10389) TaxID=936046 RepID=UPI00029F7FA6|nr:hypothetical protein AGABI2DRAFT_181675 [Agaricus bisporus var. bisporus H97]EKV41872.1 hypothetical protein AGABI2DRAFT_181675 [Agaricus bisporus var. bisporus H97]